METVENVSAIYTEPENAWITSVFKRLSKQFKTPVLPSIITYGTDASYLKEGLNHPPTVILGPGEPQLAHKTNEYCYVKRITEAKNIFSDMIEQWSNFI